MTYDEEPNAFELPSPPTDLISSVVFSPLSDQFLLASSWDCKLRLYDVVGKSIRTQFSHQAPILDCCFKDAVHCCSGDLKGQLKYFELNANTEQLIGSHYEAIKCVEFSPEANLLVTGSWDKTVRTWDLRSKETVGECILPDKVYTMAICDDKIIIGTAGRRVLIYELRNLNCAVQRRESSLKYQTRCIRAFPNKQGFVMSSIEGRVAVEYLDPSPEVQKKKFAFKCHRIKESDGVERIYPINTIAFHRDYNTFATGGSDGYVNIWDGFNKKRLYQLLRFPTHVSSLDFSPSGTHLAVASSFIYEDDPKIEKVPDSICIKLVTDQDTKPK